MATSTVMINSEQRSTLYADNQYRSNCYIMYIRPALRTAIRGEPTFQYLHDQECASILVGTRACSCCQLIKMGGRHTLGS